jgi:hypothetical protein
LIKKWDSVKRNPEPAKHPVVVRGDSATITTTFWSGERQLNRRETLRLTLSEYRGQQTADVRRWLRPGGGKPAQSTKRGVIFLVEYLPDLGALVDEALHQARAQGLLPAGGNR